MVPPETALVPVPSAELLPAGMDAPADNRNPALVFIRGQVSPQSERTVRAALATIALLGMGQEPSGSLKEARRTALRIFPWWRVTYAEAKRLRALLSDRMTAQAMGPGTVNKHIMALRGVLKESWRLGYLQADEHARVQDALRSIRYERLPAGRMLSRTELQRLFGACGSDHSPSGARDAALLALLAGCGLRRSEAVSVGRKDYQQDAGDLVIRHGKGRKDRLIPVGPGSREAIAAWLAVRGNEPGPLLLAVDKHGHIRHRAITSQAVWKALEKRVQQAGLSDISPHDLRRTFASALLDAGADLGVVQDLMGHASPVTTRKYDRRGDEAKKRAVDLVNVPYQTERPDA